MINIIQNSVRPNKPYARIIKLDFPSSRSILDQKTPLSVDHTNEEEIGKDYSTGKKRTNP